MEIINLEKELKENSITNMNLHRMISRPTQITNLIKSFSNSLSGSLQNPG